MSYVDKRLLKISKEGKYFFKMMEIGEEFTGKYTGYEMKMDDKHDKMKAHFTFIDLKGKEQIMATTSKKVIGKMARIQPGSKITMIKLGEDLKTDIEIEILSSPKQPAQEEDLPTINVEQEEVETEEETEEVEKEEEDDDDTTADF